ncbi:MAG: type IV pilus twitching motility protein PilT [Elusimicrobia bacterium]|nr:type IV pilus twitching motility protein PilT [Candidatus Obscuribacterium magneticum]
MEANNHSKVPDEVHAGNHSIEKVGNLLNSLIKVMVERRASDLHIRSGTPAVFRIDGELTIIDKTVLSQELVKEVLYLMLSPRHKKIFEAKNESDFSFAAPNLGRFRGNAFRQRGTVALVLRQIPTQIPTFSELNLPTVLQKVCQLSRGLVLICGPTGSGKSTTLASMIDYINNDRSEHIVTIEDPIEFLYKDKKSMISQRELGTDTISFSEALKHVLRQDPDVILLGEMRDLETTSTAITAAQTGHLVLSTLHTTDAVQTINRILDLFPPHQQNQMRFQLSDVIKSVVCQRLIHCAKEEGRVPACEVLVVTALVRKAIAENQMQEVLEAIRQGQYYGMQTFHQSLLKLYKDGQIKLEAALEAASNPEELMMAIRGITQGSEGLT